MRARSGKYMAGADKVARLCVIRNCRLNGFCTVCGAYACGYAFCGVDAYGKRGLEAGSIFGGLRIKIELVAFIGLSTAGI